jgi:hypothetical protein
MVWSTRAYKIYSYFLLSPNIVHSQVGFVLSPWFFVNLYYLTQPRRAPKLLTVESHELLSNKKSRQRNFMAISSPYYEHFVMFAEDYALKTVCTVSMLLELYFNPFNISQCRSWIPGLELAIWLHFTIPIRWTLDTAKELTQTCIRWPQ